MLSGKPLSSFIDIVASPFQMISLIEQLRLYVRSQRLDDVGRSGNHTDQPISPLAVEL